MYLLFSFLLGSFFSVMISINGSLVGAFDSYTGAMIIHLFGLVACGIVLLVTHRKLKFDPKAPKWMYFAGVVGICTTIFQASSFGKISMLSISALGLLGETITSLFIDSFGFFGMKKHPFQKSTLIGFLFAIAGIIIMMDSSVSSGIAAVVMSLGAGVSIVTSRSMNARLAQSVGTMQGTFLNFAAAMPVTIVLMLLLGNHFTVSEMASAPWWMYLGGIFGVVGVSLNNLLVPHLPAFQLTLLSFLGQLACSTVIDLFTGAASSRQSLIGGCLIAVGMLINMVLKHHAEQKAADRA